MTEQTTIAVLGGIPAEIGVAAAGDPAYRCIAAGCLDAWGAALVDALAAADLVVLILPAKPGDETVARTLALVHRLGVARVLLALRGGAPAQWAAAEKELIALARRAGIPHAGVVALAAVTPYAVRQIVDALLTADVEDERAPPALRLAVDVLAAGAGAERRIGGTILAGHASPGLDVALLPGASTARITAVTVTGDKAVVTLDTPVAVAPGTILVAASGRPEVADQVAAHVIWFAREALLPGRPYTIRLAGQEVTGQIGTLKHRIDPVDFAPSPARKLETGDIGLANVSFSSPLVFDAYGACRATGRFTIVDRQSGEVAGVGLIAFPLRRATNIHWQALAVDKTARAALKGQRPACLWFTGLSGSGKSTIASLLEKKLATLGRHTYTLDGDNVRHGLNRDLGFTDADRVENIRRVAEVAKLFVDAGLIVLVSFISPFRAERRLARDLFPGGEFLEIFVDTPLEECERRDPKGLYKKARAGQLKNFTGLDSPYESPDSPELRLASGREPPEVLAAEIMVDLARRGVV